MDRPGDQLLAGARLALDDHRERRAGDAGGIRALRSRIGPLSPTSRWHAARPAGRPPGRGLEQVAGTSSGVCVELLERGRSNHRGSRRPGRIWSPGSRSSGGCRPFLPPAGSARRWRVPRGVAHGVRFEPMARLGHGCFGRDSLAPLWCSPAVRRCWASGPSGIVSLGSGALQRYGAAGRAVPPRPWAREGRAQLSVGRVGEVWSGPGRCALV